MATFGYAFSTRWLQGIMLNVPYGTVWNVDKQYKLKESSNAGKG
jgi:hypothetical protein